MSVDKTIRNEMLKNSIPLGLGCSRLGSVNGASYSEAEALLELAIDKGITFFDTSNVYAQGDSEKLLGKVLAGRNDCFVCSKAGKFLPWPKQTLVPFKGILQNLTRKSDFAQKGVSDVRSKPLPQRWDSKFLMSSIHGSLRRLNRERIDMFMLHSPSKFDLLNSDAMNTIEIAKAAGKLGVIGVSADTSEVAEIALDNPLVKCLQIPLHPQSSEFDSVCKRAHNSGIIIVAREVLGGVNNINRNIDPEAFVKERLKEVTVRADVDITLIGTTKIRHLLSSIEAIQM